MTTVASAGPLRAGAGPNGATTRELLPWVAGSAGLGILSVESPLLAAGVGVTAALAVLPLMALFAVLVLATAGEGFSMQVAGMTFRPDMLVATVFAVRALTATPRVRSGAVEAALVAFMALQVVTSGLHSVDPAASIRSAAMLGFGVLAFFGVRAALATRDRLLTAVRIALVVALAAAAAGIALLAASYVIGSTFGVTRLETLSGFPAITGFAYEHDVFGSSCAAVAIVFLALWREANPLLSRQAAAVSFWICAGATLLSLARGAWLGLAAGLLVSWLAGGRRAQPMTGLVLTSAVVIALIGAGALAFSSQSVTDVGAGTASAVSTQAQQALNLRSSTGARRLVEWKTSLAEVRSSLWFGLGTNSYGQRHFERTISGPKPAFVGNWFVRILYDSGIVGLFLFLAFAVPIVWPDARLRNAKGDLAPIARALTFGCTVLAVSYLATDALLLVWPWVLLGLTRAARVLSAEQEWGSRSV